MKIMNRYVEIEVAEMEPHSPVTLRFPQTKAELTLTHTEARELWAGLDHLYGSLSNNP